MDFGVLLCQFFVNKIGCQLQKNGHAKKNKGGIERGHIGQRGCKRNKEKTNKQDVPDQTAAFIVEILVALITLDSHLLS